MKVKIALAVAAMLLLAATLAAGSPAYAQDRGFKAKPAAACANKFCTRDVKAAPSCRRFAKAKTEAKCFIKRAAANFGQDYGTAKTIAYRESRLNPKATNSSSGAAGLFQFMPGTWASTPYRKRSVYHPRWAALAAMWMWSKGGQHHWVTYY